MDKHLFDRWSIALANRRRVTTGMFGALLAGAFSAKPSMASTARLTQNDGDCSLGCESSVCGQIPVDCALFPADNIWNAPIDNLPVDANSDAYVASIGADTGLHPDFGAGLYEGSPLGIPFVRVPANQPMVEITFEVAEESDPGPYPIPLDVPIEGGSCGTGDRHVIVVQEGTCLLYELYDASQQPDGSWNAYGGARFDLTSNDLRPAEWTSADAAGMAILPGLVRYEEIAAGVIPHALRFTASVTQEAYVWPARHQAGASTEVGVPPMGQRFRLKADVDVSASSPVNQIILKALKTYGMFLADNGSDWFLSGVPDDRWDNDDLHELQELIHGSDFEAVDSTSLMSDPDSGEIA
ncbi:hypothetical protein BH09CHL1_BH09CHL1_12620 [soil metagenome]